MNPSQLRVTSPPSVLGNWRSLYHKVLCADSCSSETYLTLFNSRRADIVVTDPPYCLLERKRISGQLRDTKSVVKKIDGAKEVPRFENLSHYRRFTESWIRPTVKFGLKADSPMIIWSNFLGKRVIIDVCAELDYKFVGEYAWAKCTVDENKTSQTFQSQNNLNPNRNFTTHDNIWNTTRSEQNLRVYETALIFQPISLCQNWPVDQVMLRPNSFQKRSRIPWSVVTGYHDILNDTSVVHKHPCHKPLPAIMPLMDCWTQNNDVVLDPFVGSGGIGQAVVAAGGERQYIGIEIMNSWALEVEKQLNSQVQ
jgi:site-specific DNA-methyltransferase (adenine-specific)